MQFLTYFYLLLLLTVTVKSVLMLKKYALKAQNYLAVYLICTCVVEFYAACKKLFYNNLNNGMDFNIYLTLCITFFTFFYGQNLKNIQRKILISAAVLSLSYILFFAHPFSDKFEIGIGMTTALFYIFSSLLWFYSKINSNDLDKMTNDPLFWISTSILLWGCFFVFRVMPMFLFQSVDKNFLSLMKLILHIINIVTYSLIFIALLKFDKRSKLNRI